MFNATEAGGNSTIQNLRPEAAAVGGSLVFPGCKWPDPAQQPAVEPVPVSSLMLCCLISFHMLPPFHLQPQNKNAKRHSEQWIGASTAHSIFFSHAPTMNVFQTLRHGRSIHLDSHLGFLEAAASLVSWFTLLSEHTEQFRIR